MRGHGSYQNIFVVYNKHVLGKFITANMSTENVSCDEKKGIPTLQSAQDLWEKHVAGTDALHHWWVSETHLEWWGVFQNVLPVEDSCSSNSGSGRHLH